MWQRAHQVSDDRTELPDSNVYLDANIEDEEDIEYEEIRDEDFECEEISDKETEHEDEEELMDRSSVEPGFVTVPEIPLLGLVIRASLALLLTST